MWDPKYQIELDHYWANFDFIGQFFSLQKFTFFKVKAKFVRTLTIQSCHKFDLSGTHEQFPW